MGNQIVIPSMGNWYIEPLKRCGIGVNSVLESGTFFITLDCFLIKDPSQQMIVKAYESNEALEESNLARSCEIYFNTLDDLSKNVSIFGISNYNKIYLQNNLVFFCRKKHQFTLSQRLEEYPPLEDVEKRWISYRILTLVSLLHQITKSMIHGAINPDNVFVTWDLNVSIGDMAPFKPTYIKYNRPDLFHHFFTTASRGGCYLAPEQLITSDSETDNVIFMFGSFSMDFFAAGLVIYYLYTGEHLLSFSTLAEIALAIRRSKMKNITEENNKSNNSESESTKLVKNLDSKDYDIIFDKYINDKIKALPDDIRDLVKILLDLDPSRRLSEQSIIDNSNSTENSFANNSYDDIISPFFPPIFKQISDQLNEFFQRDMKLEHMIKLIPTFQMIIDDSDERQKKENPNDTFTVGKLSLSKKLKMITGSESKLILVNVLTNAVNLSNKVQEKSFFMNFICDYTLSLNENVKLSRILPIYSDILSIPSNFLKSNALLCILKLIASLKTIPEGYECIFSSYLIKQIKQSSKNAFEQYRCSLAYLCPKLVVEIERLNPESSAFAVETVNFILNEDKDLVIGSFIQSMRAIAQLANEKISKSSQTDEIENFVQSTVNVEDIDESKNDSISINSKEDEYKANENDHIQKDENEIEKAKESTNEIIKTNEYENTNEISYNNEDQNPIDIIQEEEEDIENSNNDNITKDESININKKEDEDANLNDNNQKDKNSNEIIKTNEYENTNEISNNNENQNPIDIIQEEEDIENSNNDNNITKDESININKKEDEDNIQKDNNENVINNNNNNFYQSLSANPNDLPRLGKTTQLDQDFLQYYHPSQCSFDLFVKFSHILLSCLNSPRTLFKLSVLSVLRDFFDNSPLNERPRFRKQYNDMSPLILGYFNNEIQIALKPINGRDSNISLSENDSETQISDSGISILNHKNDEMIEGYLEFFYWFVQRKLLDVMNMPELFLKISDFRRSDNVSIRFFASKIASSLPIGIDTMNDTIFIMDIIYQRRPRLTSSRKSSSSQKADSVSSSEIQPPPPSLKRKRNRLFSNVSSSQIYDPILPKRRFSVKNTPLLVKAGFKIIPRFIKSNKISNCPIKTIAPHFNSKLKAVVSDTEGRLFYVTSTSNPRDPNNLTIEPIPQKYFGPSKVKMSAITELKRTSLTLFVEELSNKVKVIDWTKETVYDQFSYTFKSRPIKIISKHSNISYVLTESNELSIYDCRDRSLSQTMQFDVNNLSASELCGWPQNCATLAVGFNEGLVQIVDTRMMMPISSILTDSVCCISPCYRNYCNFVVSSNETVEVFDAFLGCSELSLKIPRTKVSPYDGNVIITNDSGVFCLDCEHFENSSVLSDFGVVQNLGIGENEEILIQRDLGGKASLHKHAAMISAVDHTKELFMTGDVCGMLNFWALSDF